MKLFYAFLPLLLAMSSPQAAGEHLVYEVEGKSYEGYYVIPAADAPLVLLVHDWDGLTDYEIKRANMLAKERGNSYLRKRL